MPGSGSTAVALSVMLLAAGAGCDGAREERRAELIVAAPSDLGPAMEIFEREFEREHPRVDFQSVIGSSSKLTAQALQDAPFDLLLSADIRDAHRLVKAGMAAEGAVFPYARGRLAAVLRATRSVEIAALGTRALRSPLAGRVAIAHPALAPYGRAAMEALRNMGIETEVRERLVYAQNAGEATQFVASGAAESGILPLSLARRFEGSSGIVVLEIEAGMFEPIVQGGVALGRSAGAELAGAFRTFLTGERGRTILVESGFDLPRD